ncbi:MAG: universal stress protein [Thermodesulfobacteriota bacterium]|nr:universal stress protein [Thermodesulfobacteriota bacterium]
MAIKKITCCIDFSDNSRAAFGMALEMADTFQAKLYIIHVLPPMVNPVLADPGWVLPEEPKKSLILKLEERIQQEYCSQIERDLDYEIKVLDGHVSSQIIGFLEQNKVDLVITGSYGSSGMGLVIFGSVAKRVAHKAPCSVMIVREKNKSVS